MNDNPLYTTTTTPPSACQPGAVTVAGTPSPELREYWEMRRRALYQELRWLERALGIAQKG